ncbi:thiol:disulfide interchange protein DsbG [Janthinobacterium sp. B9-8]|uniref:thiol:disulfide interchange protein DsbG n=1 Tax=Janthinobacterium sp. B9-8 TaxID=1236179 RepID=UPI00061D260F|nr:thiol:disulfide interchange protein DsbG [Janthinobacterium sp. B9-8]AMC33522.1 dihydroneopterin aldolase [Janthinobacterium sp. B9-8]
MKVIITVLVSSLLIMSHAQAASNWPAPIKALESKGMEVLDSFKAPGGVTGYAALYQQQPVTVYLTADGKQAIIGSMVDSKGEPLNQAHVDQLFSNKLWKQLEESHWIRDGNKNAPRIVYMFTDPNCPYCNKLWNDARPWVNAGKVQIRHIMVGIIKSDSMGKAAALMTSKAPEAALYQHEKQHASGGVKPLAQIPKDARSKLDANYQLMQRFGAFATPVTFYKDSEGKMQKTQGAPPAEMLPKIFGPR